jgi:hypothetical protein
MKVYIILTDTGTLFTKLIKVFTRRPLNHASISFSRELDNTYSFGRKRPHNPFVGGFVKENLRGELFKRAVCAIYSFSVSECEYKKMLHFVQQVEDQQRYYKYNFLGLLGVLFRRKWNRKNAFFCSEFVASVLSNAGMTIKNKPACFVKPNDLTDCTEFKLIYAGDLRSYLLEQGDRDALTEDEPFSDGFHVTVVPLFNRVRMFF